jgi:hypothetical protein
MERDLWALADALCHRDSKVLISNGLINYSTDTSVFSAEDDQCTLYLALTILYHHEYDTDCPSIAVFMDDVHGGES